MLDKIFNKFIALIIVAMVTFLFFINFIIFPQISQFFYNTEVENIHNQLQRIETMAVAKQLNLQKLEQFFPDKSNYTHKKQILMNDLKQQIGKITIDKSGFIYIVENAQIAVNKEKLPKNIENSDNFFEDIRKSAESKQALISQENGIKQESFVKYVEFFGWYLVARIHESDLYQKSNALNNMIWNVTCVTLLIMLIVGAILLKKMFRPLDQLSQDVQKVESGDFSVRCHLDSKDEIGILSQHFNFMLDTLENNIKDLEKTVENRTKELKDKLLYDEVTGLKNRYTLLNELATDARTLILIDINSFNDVNELYGYKVGNEVLLKFGKFLNELAKKSNSEAYKIYGNVYAILYTAEMFQFDKFELFLQSIIDNSKKEPILVDELDIKIYLDITLGIAICQENSLKKSNIALQKAKKRQRKFIVYNSEIDRKQIIQDTIFWRNKIEIAINHNKIIPFSQAIVNRNQEIIKYEMLMRMEDKDENGEIVYLSPFKFLDISVKTKQYLALSTIMISKSLDLLLTTDKLISINLSFLDIDDINFVNFLEEKFSSIDKKHYPRIVFEILESEKISNYEIFEDFIKQYRKMGVKIAIDDFGTGYSNFSHITTIRPDYLKIDASLIKDIDTNSDSFELVKSITAFSKALNMKTIAEYVHSQKVFEIAYELGIDEFQGYYFNEPEKDFK